jgi:hypothetical protein
MISLEVLGTARELDGSIGPPLLSVVDDERTFETTDSFGVPVQAESKSANATKEKRVFDLFICEPRFSYT